MNINIYDETFMILEEWNIPYNYKRPNVSGIKKVVQWGQDKKFGRTTNVGNGCESGNFGLTQVKFQKKGNVLQKAKLSKKYPHIEEQLNKLGKEILPSDFEWSSMCVNKNLTCLKHRDKYNKGHGSYIVAFGPYTGGRLMLYKEDGIEYVDINEKPLLFDGHEYEHETEPFEGTRYSVIFYYK